MAAAAAPGRGNPNLGRTPMMVALNGGRGAAFAAGPGFDRLSAPPFREPSNREPYEAIKVLLAAAPTRTRRRPMAPRCCTRPSPRARCRSSRP
jgi:hypothetical protein